MRLLSLIVFFAFFIALGVSAQTEVIYPSLPGVVAPQEIAGHVGSQEEIFPLFMAYLFRLIVSVSVVVCLGIIFYGGVLYIISAGNPEKRYNAKSWILSALHGALVIFASYAFLFALDSRLVVFNLNKLEDGKGLESVTLQWTIKQAYFQIPFGLLVEEAATNENARDRFYDILDAVYDAEDTADAILWGGKDLLGIIDVCPIGMECCDDFPFCEWPPIPFAMLQRPKEPRPNLDCFWNSLAKRAPNIVAVVRPSLKHLDPGSVAKFLNIEDTKQKIKITLNEFEDVVTDFFPPRIQEEDSLFPLQEALLEIIRELDEILLHQKTGFDLVIEIRKVTRKIDVLIEKYPILRDPPFWEVIQKMSGDWILGSESMAKGEKGFKETPYIEQDDIRWRHIRYNYDTFYSSACLLASTVMAFNNLNVEIDLFDALRFSKENGHAAGVMGGTMFTFPCHFASVNGLDCKRVTRPGPSHFNEMINWLESKGPIVIGGKGHPWSMGGGHAILLTGVDRGKRIIYLNDSSRAFLHSVTFGEVLANMPIELAYLSKRETSIITPEEIPAVCEKTSNEVLASHGGGDGSCPEISCAIAKKINEIMLYMFKHERDLWVIFFAKDLKKEGLYQLYKALMLKSLGIEHLLSYGSLLSEKSVFNDKEEVLIETDRDFTKIHRYNTSGESPYIWDWQKWINNIVYKQDIDCHVTISNDPATFYLRKPDADEIIKDALIGLAYSRKQADIQYLQIERLLKKDTLLSQVEGVVKEVFSSQYIDLFFSSPIIKKQLESLKISPEIVWYYNRFVKTRSPLLKASLSPDYNAVMILNNYFLENGINPSLITEEEFLRILRLLDISPQSVTLAQIRNTDITHPSDYLTCGMEIPVGETFQLIWDHFIDLLFTMDGYIVEGLYLLELQEYMNYLASFCSCPCMDPCCECMPPAPGACVLTCDKAQINALYYGKIVPTRVRMFNIAEYIKHLTQGFFRNPSENICDSLNQDIRDDEEKRLCNSGGKRFITKHELITRKLSYSRYALDECTIRPDQIGDVLEGTTAGRTPIFGPYAEEKDLKRFTKTKKDGAMINTHEFNWFCCFDTKLDQ